MSNLVSVKEDNHILNSGKCWKNRFGVLLIKVSRCEDNCYFQEQQIIGLFGSKERAKVTVMKTMERKMYIGMLTHLRSMNGCHMNQGVNGEEPTF